MIVLDGLVLPDGLLWSDEFGASQVAQSVKRTLDGSVIVYYGQLRSGLPITLESEANSGWMTRALVEELSARAAGPGAIYSMSLRGQTRQVMFRHQDPPAFEARPLVARATPAPGDFYLATVKLMTL